MVKKVSLQKDRPINRPTLQRHKVESIAENEEPVEDICPNAAVCPLSDPAGPEYTSESNRS